LVPGKDNVYQKFLLGIVLGESFALEVDFGDDIDDFLTPSDIPQSQLITPHKE
jgi:hypothetical protein